MQKFTPETGPPPRTRGTRCAHQGRRRGPGTTPAYAGNAPTWLATWALSRDHPRVRGERSACRRSSGSRSGPPPRTRGTRRLGSLETADHGTTPAYAGNAFFCWTSTVRSRDHPRVRGERAPGADPTTAARGPPPRTRGTRPRRRRRRRLDGTTPAYAGNATGPDARHASSRDHPRVRGERVLLLIFVATRLGPPPRTRGTLVCVVVVSAVPGTTPAYAGNASTGDFVCGRVRDHPRVRGERLPSGSRPCWKTGPPRVRGERNQAWTELDWGMGPPPRTRGTLALLLLRPVIGGTTPAYAGNAGLPVSRSPGGGGPPPRTRGTQRPARRRPAATGTTPAYAGNAFFPLGQLGERGDHPRVRGERAC